MRHAPIEQMLAALDSPALSPELELARALREGRPAVVKLTVFFAEARLAAADVARMSRYLAAVGHSPACFEQLDAALASKGDDGRERQALHAVGLEVPASAAPKINVYVQPVT